MPRTKPPSASAKQLLLISQGHIRHTAYGPELWCVDCEAWLPDDYFTNRKRSGEKEGKLWYRYADQCRYHYAKRKKNLQGFRGTAIEYNHRQALADLLRYLEGKPQP